MENKNTDSLEFSVNNIVDDETMATVHSAKEEIGDCFRKKEEIGIIYKTQIILTNNKTEEFKILQEKSIIFIAESDFAELENIFRRFITKGKIGIYQFQITITTKYN